MTECTCKSLVFSSLFRERTLPDFNGGHLTSDGGALLLWKANRRTGLITALTGCILDPRDPARGLREHDQSSRTPQKRDWSTSAWQGGWTFWRCSVAPIRRRLSRTVALAGPPNRRCPRPEAYAMRASRSDGCVEAGYAARHDAPTAIEQH